MIKSDNPLHAPDPAPNISDRPIEPNLDPSWDLVEIIQTITKSDVREGRPTITVCQESKHPPSEPPEIWPDPPPLALPPQPPDVPSNGQAEPALSTSPFFPIDDHIKDRYQKKSTVRLMRQAAQHAQPVVASNRLHYKIS